MFFILVLSLFALVSARVNHLENTFSCFKEYSTYSQAGQLVTISPDMNGKATSKGAIPNITFKALQENQKVTILGVGALSTKPLENASATVELYLTYAEGDPRQNFNMLQINTCGGFVPNRGVPFLKQALNFERQRLFEKVNCTPHDNYLKTLHFKAMYKSSMVDQGAANIAPTYAQTTATRILADCDRRSMWSLLSKNNALEQHVIVIHQNIIQERRNTEALRLENYKLRASYEAAASRTAERLERATEANETLTYENRGLKTHVQDLVSSTGTQREESARTITHLQQELDSNLQKLKTTSLENPYRGVSDATS